MNTRAISRRLLLSSAAALLPLTPAVARALTSRRADETRRVLFDGTSLGQWEPIQFGGEGEVSIVDGAIRLEHGNDLTGVRWTGALPGASFRIEVEARRVSGSDFFCSVTVPVGENHCTLVVGGWGGGVVGFSNLDTLDASENDTGRNMQFEDGRWYRVAVDVIPDTLTGLIDGVVVAQTALKGRGVDVRAEMLPCRPIGIASWRTTADIRAITLLER